MCRKQVIFVLFLAAAGRMPEGNRARVKLILCRAAAVPACRLVVLCACLRRGACSAGDGVVKDPCCARAQGCAGPAQPAQSARGPGARDPLA